MSIHKLRSLWLWLYNVIYPLLSTLGRSCKCSFIYKWVHNDSYRPSPKLWRVYNHDYTHLQPQLHTEVLMELFDGYLFKYECTLETGSRKWVSTLGYGLFKCEASCDCSLYSFSIHHFLWLNTQGAQASLTLPYPPVIWQLENPLCKWCCRSRCGFPLPSETTKEWSSKKKPSPVALQQYDHKHQP